MIEACGKMEACPFFAKFKKHEKGFRYLYCEGPLKEQCARITYKEQNGVKPPDELAPTGVIFDLGEPAR
jgi:hypothetical protein